MSVTINGSSGLVFNDASTQNTAATGFGFKNRIINGAMMIDQRNAGASITPTTTGTYSLDRWRCGLSVASKFSAQQSTTAPTGFKNSLLVTSTSAYTVGASETFNLSQYIEGLNCADLGFGTATASTVTLSFWVRSSLTGTFGGSLKNENADRSYPFSYTILSANTWEQKSVTIAGDTTGTWLTTNGVGIAVIFSLGSGSSYASTAGSWAAGNYVTATGATSVVGTNGATFYITGVQLEKGSTATSFDYRPYGTELALCHRYCKVFGENVSGTGLFSGVWYTTTGVLTTYIYPVQMRSAPTLSVSAASDFNVVSAGNADSCSGVSLAGATTSSTRIDFTSSFARTAGNGSEAQAANSSAKLTFNAEL